MKRSSSKKIAESKPTTPDLVLLSLLAERPMHGYQAYSLLVFREWGISRPQVYYSLEKLDRLGLIRSARDAAESGGPERRVFATTDSGRAALADALEQEDWTTHFDQPLFLTWLALSWQARPGVFLKQLERRKDFLEAELARKQEILRAVQKEVGHRYHEAVWILSLLIGRLRTELRWLRNVIRESPLRAPAREPEYLGNPGRT
ncbi:MAG TPA: PadR family transcriptional regulator [Bryobacteraceae bacterium]|nr:PadR family transcriptional regulator [Bryobacteraceae bacterium]